MSTSFALPIKPLTELIITKDVPKLWFTKRVIGGWGHYMGTFIIFTTVVGNNNLVFKVVNATYKVTSSTFNSNILHINIFSYKYCLK